MISVILLKISASILVSTIFYLIICATVFEGEWYRQHRTDTFVYRILAGTAIWFFLLTFCAGIVLAIWGV